MKASAESIFEKTLKAKSMQKKKEPSRFKFNYSKAQENGASLFLE